MTHHDAAHEDSEDRFYAQFDSREVELMTLDELAAAFEAGRIHANTFVCREGEEEWLTLAEVAGLGDEEEPEAAPQVEQRPAMPERRPEMPAAAGTRPAMPERRPEMPVAAGVRPEVSSLPPAASAVSSPALSFAPVTSNIDFSALDVDELALRPKRRWGLVLAAAATLVVGGGGAVFALNGGSGALASTAPTKSAMEAAASQSQASLTLPKPSEPVAAPAAPSTPEPVAAAVPDAPSAAPKAAEFSDDMKSALLAQDKARQGKTAQKAKKGRATASAPAAHRSKAAPSAGLKSTGSAYDPLNGKL